MKSIRIIKSISLLAPALLLTGCFATEQDLEPMRSDIMVLEKQFSEVQKQVTKAKYTEEDKTMQSQVLDKLSDMDKRIVGMEKRLDSLETTVRDLKAGQTPAAPQPIPQEPGAEAAPGAAVPEAGRPAPKAEEPKAPQPTKGMLAAEEAYNEAMAAYNAGDLDKAAGLFNAFLQDHPNDRLSDDSRFMLGEIAFTKKDYDGAIKEYQKVVEEYPLADRVPDALYKTGVAYNLLGNPDKARESFTRVMDNYPYSDAAKKAREALEKPVDRPQKGQ